jgi:hypothetical protein
MERGTVRTTSSQRRHVTPKRGTYSSTRTTVMEKQGGWAKDSRTMRACSEDDDGFRESVPHGTL